jgi:polar amino acid transport system substrate-binding protein
LRAQVHAGIIGRVLPRIPPRLALLVAACAALATACGPAVDSTRSVEAEIAPPDGLATPGHFTVAVPTDLPPYGYRGKSGSEGFALDLGQAMAARMGVKLTVVALDPQDLPAAARGGGVDVVLGTLEISRAAPPPPDLMLVPYLKGDSILLVRPDSPFQPRQLDELCGRRVAVVTGTPQEARLAEAGSICGNAAPSPVAVRTDTDARAALKQQQADAYVADSATAAYDRARSGDVMASGDRFAQTQLAMGMRTGGTPLTDAITRDFYLIHSDGTYELLLQKWGMTAQTL